MIRRTVTDTPATASEVSPIRVLIADDESVFLRGLGVVLSIGGRIEVVGVAENGEEAVARAVELVPDVVLLDVQMPGMNGIEAARVISQQVPITKIIMLTASDEEDDLFEALKAGASGYLRKDTSIEEVAAVIRGVAQGQSLITPSMASKLLIELRLWDPADEASPACTSRELDVLKLVAKGMSSAQIGAELGISENLAESHIRNLLEKLRRGRSSPR
jgi:two-component system NarL family response regulator